MLLNIFGLKNESSGYNLDLFSEQRFIKIYVTFLKTLKSRIELRQKYNGWKENFMKEIMAMTSCHDFLSVIALIHPLASVRRIFNDNETNQAVSF